MGWVNRRRSHFAQILAALDACGVPYTVNPRLVRGLDYYSRTTFEFTIPSSDDPASGLGTQNALLGEDEVRSALLTVKTFASGEQTRIAQAHLAQALRA